MKIKWFFIFRTFLPARSKIPGPLKIRTLHWGGSNSKQIYLVTAQEPNSEGKNVLENVLENFLEIFLEICYTRKMKKSWLVHVWKSKFNLKKNLKNIFKNIFFLRNRAPVTSIPILCCIEFWSSPGWFGTSAASYCPRRLGNFQNWCQQNIGIEVTGHPV